MKLPQKIRVGGHKIKIILRSDIEDRLHGETNYNDNTITLNCKLHPTQLVETFYHELLHVLNSEMEHKEVEYLAQSLAQIHLDNDIYFYKKKK